LQVALDPHAEGLLEALQAQGLKSFEQMSVEEARTLRNLAVTPRLGVMGDSVADFVSRHLN
jgi:hypothetical protein